MATSPTAILLVLLDYASPYPSRTLTILGLLVAGVLFLLLAYWSHSKRQELHELGSHTTGTVLSLETRQNFGEYQSSNALYPVIKFITTEQQTIIRHHPFGQYPPKYTVGEQIDVYYDTDEPTRYVLGSEPHSIEFWIFLGFGLALTALGLFLAALV